MGMAPKYGDETSEKVDGNFWSLIIAAAAIVVGVPAVTMWVLLA